MDTLVVLVIIFGVLLVGFILILPNTKENKKNPNRFMHEDLSDFNKKIKK